MWVGFVLQWGGVNTPGKRREDFIIFRKPHSREKREDLIMFRESVLVYNESVMNQCSVSVFNFFCVLSCRLVALWGLCSLLNEI